MTMRVRSALRFAVWAIVAAAIWPLQQRAGGGTHRVATVAGTESWAAERLLRGEFGSPFTDPALLVIGGGSRSRPTANRAVPWCVR